MEDYFDPYYFIKHIPPLDEAQRQRQAVLLGIKILKAYMKVNWQPSWRSWLARQSHNLKVVSSSLTEGIFCLEFFFS